jgi:hypothetical protein
MPLRTNSGKGFGQAKTHSLAFRLHAEPEQ